MNPTDLALTGSQHCWLEVDAAALRHNASVAREFVGPDRALMGVVKANGYGHGLALAGGVLETEIDWFGVASAAEGIALREAGCVKPVFILGAALPGERAVIADRGFVPAISTKVEGDAYDAIAAKAGKKMEVHIAIDTGMGRIGFHLTDAKALARLVQSWAHLRVDGVMSHMPSADEDAEFTMLQVEMFEAELAELRAAGLSFRTVHMANSAGLLDFKCPSCTMSRAGLMLYGVSPLPHWQEHLRATLRWKTQVTLVRELPPGCGISYGRTFITNRSPFTRVATIAAGYGDGYHRALTGQGAEVLIHAQRCPVIGRVTMDQMMVDVSDLAQAVVPGDEVILLGDEISANELAEKAGTIPWEILTSISQRVARVLC